jgi:Spy/CpxP family protein refolding chaperone
MKRWKLLAGVAFVFVLGIMVGSLGTKLYFEHRFSRPRGGPPAMRAFLLKKFSQELDLTEEQKSEFKKSIDLLDVKLREHFRKSHSEIGGIISQGQSQMRGVLTTNQQEKFDKLIERFERRRKTEGQFGPRRRPPRPR